MTIINNPRFLKKRKEKTSSETKDFYHIHVKEIIDKKTSKLPLIEKDESVSCLLAILCRRDHAWVVNNLENKELVGVITEHDLLNLLSPPKEYSFFGFDVRRSAKLNLTEKVESIMTYDPVTCSINEKVKDVIQKMNVHRCRRLAVVTHPDNRIVGEITLHDTIRYYYQKVKHLICTPNVKKNFANEIPSSECFEEHFPGHGAPFKVRDNR